MFTFTKKQSTILPSSSLSEKSPLISHIIENNNDNSNKENHQ